MSCGTGPRPVDALGVRAFRAGHDDRAAAGARSGSYSRLESMWVILMNLTVDDNVVSPISIILNWANLLKK